LASLAGYNTVAILLFLILNSPSLYPRLKTMQEIGWNMVRSAVGKPRKGTSDKSHGSYTIGSMSHEEQSAMETLRSSFFKSDLPLLTLGHMVITTAAPLITAILITRQYPPNTGPSIWAQVSHWATRPRMTGPMMFLFACLQVFYHPDLEQQPHETAEAFAERKWCYDDSHPGARKMSPYGTAVLVACFGDQIVSALGLDNVNLMIVYARAEYLVGERTPLIKSLQILRVGIAFGFAADLGILWFLGRDVQLNVLKRRKGMPKGTLTVRNGEIWIMSLTLLLLAAHLFLGFVGGWMVWKAFLELETRQNYCVQSLWQVDLVYYLLPVVLNLWRILAKRAEGEARAEGDREKD
jgi:hypothetical protein